MVKHREDCEKKPPGQGRVNAWCSDRFQSSRGENDRQVIGISRRATVIPAKLYALLPLVPHTRIVRPMPRLRSYYCQIPYNGDKPMNLNAMGFGRLADDWVGHFAGLAPAQSG